MLRRRLTSSWRGPSIYDDAIDWSATPRAEYIRMRDPAVVVYRPGATPTLWTLRDLRQSEIAYLRDYQDRGEVATAYQRAFSLACEACSDGEVSFTRDHERVYITDAALETIPPAVILELGAVALQRAMVMPGELPRFTLPRGSPPIPMPLPATTATCASDSGPDHPCGSSEDAPVPSTT